MKRSSKPRKNPLKRPLGLYRGQIWMSPDFNDPWELVETADGWELRPEGPKAAEQLEEKPKEE
jgi:hypothetical protein